MLHFQLILDNSYLKNYHLFNQLINKNHYNLLIKLKIFNLDQSIYLGSGGIKPI